MAAPSEPNPSAWNQSCPGAAGPTLPSFVIFGHICDVNSEKQTFFLRERGGEMSVHTVNNLILDDCRESLSQKYATVSFLLI